MFQVKVVDTTYRHNTVIICVPKDLKSHIGSTDVVVKEIHGQLTIRAATIMDTKTLKIDSMSKITLTCDNAKDYLGEWILEPDGDLYWFYRNTNN